MLGCLLADATGPSISGKLDPEGESRTKLAKTALRSQGRFGRSARAGPDFDLISPVHSRRIAYGPCALAKPEVRIWHNGTTQQVDISVASHRCKDARIPPWAFGAGRAGILNSLAFGSKLLPSAGST